MENAICDLIIRIKNGYMARKETVIVSYSRFAEAVLTKLKQLAFIKDFVVEGEKIKMIKVELLYREGVAAVTDIKIVSKPGYRVYVPYRYLRPILSGLGYSILSTSKGIVTNSEAKKAKMGGELLFNLW